MTDSSETVSPESEPSAAADHSSPSDAPPLAEHGLRWWAMTDKGRFRNNNEDAFLCVTFDAHQVYRLGKSGEGTFGRGDFVFAVSDGMGGAKAGEFASSIALDKITRLFPAAYRMGGRALRHDPQGLLKELFEQSHAEMLSMSFHYEECRGMGATLSLGWFAPGCLYYGHAGDTRIYHLPEGGSLRQVTEDHTHVAWLLRKGLISRSQARVHPARSRLEMVLGGNSRSVQPQIGSVSYEPGDRFLFCSDGINDGISDRIIEDMIRNPSARAAQWTPAERLIHEAGHASRDNMTAIVVQTL